MPADESKHPTLSVVRRENTSPEVLLRKYLHSAGFRFRLHRKDLPGTPDIVLPRFKAAVFVHGCFWHQHSNCELAVLPKSNIEFWREKFRKNQARDEEARTRLRAQGWRVLTVWERGLSKASPETRKKVLGKVSEWLRSQDSAKELPDLCRASPWWRGATKESQSS